MSDVVDQNGDPVPNMVEIANNQYPVYVNHAAATVYLAASAVLREPWGAADDSDQAAALITASRRFDSLDWDGQHDTREQRIAEQRILDAASLWAGLIVEEPDNADPYGNPQAVAQVGVGDASIDNVQARPTSPTVAVADDALVAARLNLPTQVFTLIKSFLVYGTDDTVDPAHTTQPAAIGHSSTVLLPTALDDVPYGYRTPAFRHGY